jgi:uncharacterized protein YdaU (DUF1376 family)
MRLLIAEWRRPNCDLPNDDRFLGRTVGDAKNWYRLKPVVMAFFDLGPHNVWTQKRLLAVREETAHRVEAFSSGGRATALKNKERASARHADSGVPSTMPSTPKNAADMSARHSARHSASIPRQETEKVKTVSQNGGYARGRGVPPVGETLADENLEKFMTRLAKELDGSSAGKGWAIVSSATDHADPLFGRCLLLCKVTAKKLGKGWPFNWPTDHAIFDRIVTGGLSEEQAPHDQQI